MGLSPSSQPVATNAVQSVKQAEAPKKQQPCGEGRYSSNDDLCAQWKAADAARESAKWAQWSFYLGIVGTFGLLVTLYYTRAAVKVAQDATKDADTAIAIATRNADAAQEQVKVSHMTAERQLRAYVGIDEGQIVRENFDSAYAHLVLRNFGTTPAYEFRCAIETAYRPQDHRFRIIGPSPDIVSLDLMPSQGHLLQAPIINAIAEKLINATVEMAHFVIIAATYRDAFDKPRIFNQVLIDVGSGLRPYAHSNWDD